MTNVFKVSRVGCLALGVALRSSAAAALVGGASEAPDLGRHLVMVLQRSGTRAGFCTGSVLARDVVLTAAHCIGPVADTRVFFRDSGGQPVLRDVAASAVHPGFRADAVTSRKPTVDLALIRLAAPLPDAYAPLALARESGLESGTKVRIAGYGIAVEGAANTGGVLRSAVLTVTRPLSKLLLWMTDTGGGGLGACAGDSGGPVFTTNALEIVAVTAFADGSGQKSCGALTQATWVAPHMAWIEANLARWR